MSETECRTAATLLGKIWYGHINGPWSNHIPGCFEGHGTTFNSGTGNGNIHFNRGGRYGANQRGYAICKGTLIKDKIGQGMNITITI